MTLENILQPEDDLCFLVGAGISVDKPFSLPTGYEFMRSALRRLIPEEEQDNIIALMDPNWKALGVQVISCALNFVVKFFEMLDRT